VNRLVARKKLAIDFVRVERSEQEEAGTFDLDGLFIRLGHAIERIGAKRVVLDTVETLFACLPNQGILRAELRRLFRWLKEKGVTTIITGERGAGSLTRHGLEEYVSDCVLLLDHRIIDRLSTRLLRVVKYRGSAHGTNEYPFFIDEHGFSVLSIDALSLEHAVSSERISSGIAALDMMLSSQPESRHQGRRPGADTGRLGGRGFYRGSSILVSGASGTGKTSVAGHFVDAACGRGERCLFFGFEESPRQIARNLRSIGLDLDRWTRKGLLKLHTSRPSLCGLEMHLVSIRNAVEAFHPRVVVLDPISALSMAGQEYEVTTMMIRLVDFLKVKQITVMLTSLTQSDEVAEATATQISSLIDSWLLLRDVELNGERNRGLYVLKSRGMAHSNQIREFRLTDRGVELREAYIGPSGMLVGSARLAQEAQEKAAKLVRAQEMATQRRDLERKRAALEARIAALQADFSAQETEAKMVGGEQQQSEDMLQDDRREMARSRRADSRTVSTGQTRRRRS
jgi:circadian clock protein KaiC